MQERENILRIFLGTKDAIKYRNTAEIKILSNRTTNTASLTQDPDNIAAAVVVYSLSKIIEREDYRDMPGWGKFYQSFLISVDKIIDALKRKDDEAFREEIRIIRSAINKLSGKLKENIQDVFRRAQINKASRLYEHGISMEKTANLLGVSLFELAEYAGESQTDFEGAITISAKQRIKFAMDLFEK